MHILLLCLQQQMQHMEALFTVSAKNMEQLDWIEL